MSRQNQRDTVRNRAVAVKNRGNTGIIRIIRIAIDKQICPVLLFQENSDASGFIRINVCIGLKFKIGPLCHLDAVDEQNTAADDIEVAVDHERSDAVDPGRCNRQVLVRSSDELLGTVIILQDDAVILCAVTPLAVLSGSTVFNIDHFPTDHKNGIGLNGCITVVFGFSCFCGAKNHPSRSKRSVGVFVDAECCGRTGSLRKDFIFRIILINSQDCATIHHGEKRIRSVISNRFRKVIIFC